MACHCYGLKSAAPALQCIPVYAPVGVGGETPRRPSYAPEPAPPVYSPFDPTYRGGETPTVNPYESQGGCETLTYAPTSAFYVPQNPNCGGGSHHGSPIGYHPLTGVPQYKTRKMSPSFTPPPPSAAPKPTYKPTTPSYCPSSPLPHSPHTAAAARSRALKWGA